MLTSQGAIGGLTIQLPTAPHGWMGHCTKDYADGSTLADMFLFKECTPTSITFALWRDITSSTPPYPSATNAGSPNLYIMLFPY